MSTVKHGKTVPEMPTCWLCRVIGHKWVTRRKYSVDGVSISDTVLWECCARCGEPTPDRIMDATANVGGETSRR